jgi:hypothetical protein
MRFHPIREVRLGEPDDWQLCFQWGLSVYDDGTSQHGYRFISRRPDGSLQARGAARIRHVGEVVALIDKAREEGWGELEGEGD